MKIYYILLIIIAALSANASGQTQESSTSGDNRLIDLSLDQCIDIGNNNNLSMQSSRLDFQLDKPAIRAAWGKFLPSISIGYSIDQSSFLNRTYLNPDGSVAELDSVIKGNRRNSNYFLRASESFYDGGRNYYNLKNARLESERRNHLVSTEFFNLRADITIAYCQTIAAIQRVDLANEVLTQRYRLLNLATVRFQTGSVTRRDVMQAEVDLGRAQNDSLTSGLELKRARERLKLITGLPLDSTFNIKPLPPLHKPEWSVQKLTSQALKTRGDLLSNNTSIKINHNNISAMKGEYLPTLTGSLTHSRTERSGTNAPFTLKPRNRSTSYDMSLFWQAFDRFTRSLRIQEAKLLHDKSRIRRTEIERLIRQQVWTAFDNIESIYQLSLVAEQNTELALETNRFEEERYRLGSATTIDIGAAQVSYIQARNDQIRLETEFYIALGELENATGLILRKTD